VAITQKLGSRHMTLDGTLVQANASHKSCVPMEVFLKPAEYTRRIREHGPRTGPGFWESHGHVSRGAPLESDACLDDRSRCEPGAQGEGDGGEGGYTVNGLMENRHRLLLGINGEMFRGPASETDGGRALMDTFHKKHARRIQTVGADKGYFAKPFRTALFRRRIRPPIAAKTTGGGAVHQRVRRPSRTVGYQLSPRARKKSEELWGEAKCWHGFRRFHRRRLVPVRDEAYLMGWLLNLKRLATRPRL
jgi:hypothetical protein